LSELLHNVGFCSACVSKQCLNVKGALLNKCVTAYYYAKGDSNVILYDLVQLFKYLALLVIKTVHCLAKCLV
jgi:hypothetical protein